MSAAVLSLAGVSKRYGDTVALDGVDLQVGAGEFVALLGPNGAGKSTLFQLLSGLFVADAGRVCVHGHDMAHSPVAALAALGIVFQAPTLDLDLSVAQNLAFHCRLHGLPPVRHRAAIEAGLERLGLAALRERRCRALSGGERRKVELARALLHRPSALLMDEATVGLDPASRQALLADVRALAAEQGLAVLWTTHLVEEVEGTERIVVLDRGRLLIDGDAAAICAAGGGGSLLDAFIQLTHKTSPRRDTP